MSYWTANGFIMGASQGVGEDGRIDTRSPSASTSPALVRHTNTCVPSSSRHHTTSTSASVYHPDAAAAQPILATLPPWDHIPLHAQSISHQGAVSPLSSDYRSLSPSMYDEAYLQALIAPYQAVSSEPTGHYREPSDLNGIINEKELRLMKRCGGGGYGDVYSLRHILLGDIALKRIREAGNDDVVAQGRELARKEAKIWCGLKHPHVVEFYGIYATQIHFFFVSRFARNGTVMDYIERHPSVDRLRLLSEAAGGLAYLHSSRIIHGDVKAANILISDKETAMICDFGMSRPMDVTSGALHGAGSTRWTSPEVLQDHPRTPASDVWSLGLTISEVLSGCIPYAELRGELALARAIIEEHKRPQKEPKFSPRGISYSGAWDAATLCWADEPSERPTMEDIHLRLLSARPVSYTLDGHTSLVWAVAFSPDSKTLASASADRTIRLWDIGQGIPLGKPLSGHTATVNSVAFSPDCTTLVSGSDDRTLRLWDVTADGTKNEALTGHGYWICSIAFSPDGRTLASGSGDNTIRIWDSVSRSCVAVLMGHTDRVSSVAFSPDGKLLVSGSWDGSVRRWDMATYAQIPTPMEVRGGAVYAVAFSPDGRTVVSGSGSGSLATSQDNTIYLWDVHTGRQKGAPFQGQFKAVYSVAFHPNGRLLASGSYDKTIMIWDLTAKPPRIRVQLADYSTAVWSVAFSPDGKWLASGSEGTSVRLWDLEVLLGTF